MNLLPCLVELGAAWAQVSSTIASAGRLSTLYLEAYRPHDLSPLTSLAALKAITLKDRPRLRSLAGLAELSSLRKLGVFLAKDLADITELRARPELEELQLQSCRKIEQIDDVAACQNLRMLNLSECGDIATLRPISGLAELEDLALFGTTKIVDGDLTPIAGLPRLKQLRMQSRRSYRPSVEEIKAGLPRQ